MEDSDDVWMGQFQAHLRLVQEQSPGLHIPNLFREKQLHGQVTTGTTFNDFVHLARLASCQVFDKTVIANRFCLHEAGPSVGAFEGKKGPAVEAGSLKVRGLAPVLLEMDVAPVMVALVGFEAPIFQHLDDTFRFRVRVLACFPILFGNPDHGWISAKENMG